ncbi:MFS transporter, partial [Francisella tularensis]|uniref:MFS transporter n=1 Tax=Francisella tularensis TaxID=263 RepID=UPI00174C82D7
DLKTILDTEFLLVHITITSYLLDFSISQLLYGPFSDRFGRYPVMLVGTCFFIIRSIICIFSNHINTLIYARMITGFGAAAGGVIDTVAVKDAFKVNEQGAEFAIMTLALSITPAYVSYTNLSMP